jgi:predicted ABC-type ATPase
MEHHLWAYGNEFGWFAVDPEECHYDRDQVHTAQVVLEADTKHSLMQKAEEEGFVIAMWLE